MSFSIVCNNPRGGGRLNEADETLGDAVQSVFELDDEDAELEWNGMVFSLNYKYDFGMMIDDAVSLIAEMIASTDGRAVIEWVSTGFPFTWKIDWSDDWVSVLVTSRDPDIEQKILVRDGVKTTKREFVRQWQSVFLVIMAKLAAAGYGERYLSSLRDACDTDRAKDG
ncbi:hypothetical protein [Sorangium sp. So ce341]|uniref:hypothetical protein n=1 Tax=Sorangium sp. So ce341 TaxID=3133302 RepID=UPI003F606156